MYPGVAIRQTGLLQVRVRELVVDVFINGHMYFVEYGVQPCKPHTQMDDPRDSQFLGS